VSIGQILAPKPRKEAERGIAALKQGNAAEAQKHFETAYQLAPANADINYLMGITFEKRNDPANAEHYLGRAISLNPHHSGALLELGNVRLERGDIAGAIAVLEPAVLASPKSWPAHESLAVAYFRAQNFEKAHDQAELAIRESKGAATEPQLLLAETLVKLDRRPEALKAVQDLFRHHPYLESLPGVRDLLEQIKADRPSIVNLH
jgi:tetratricopeptide (TPR) repeat protein